MFQKVFWSIFFVEQCFGYVICSRLAAVFGLLLKYETGKGEET